MKIGLALGGGGARGLAHLGLLKAVEERGFEVAAIAGTSMGGMIGAFYAAGHSPDEIARIARELKLHDFLRPGKHGALLGGKGIETFLGKHLPGSFEDLRIPLEVAATDLQNGTLVIFNKGPLVPAIRASSAIPGILEPVFIDDRVYADGGLLNNIPVDVARTMTRHPVVACEVSPPPDREIHFGDDLSLAEKIKAALELKQFQWLTAELFLKLYHVPAALITRMRLGISPPDVLVAPPLPKDFKMEDFWKLDLALEAGYEAARTALDRQLERASE